MFFKLEKSALNSDVFFSLLFPISVLYQKKKEIKEEPYKTYSNK